MDAASWALRDPKDKMRSLDRVLVLGTKDGKKPKSSSGIVDNRLFTGENNLHAILDRRTCLWGLSYDAGTVPQPLRQKFTSFEQVLKFVKDYFDRRDIEIKQVLD